MKQILFFALKEDLVPILNDVERDYPLRYTRTGQYPSPAITSFGTGMEIPNLGRASRESASASESFLITDPATPLAVRPIARFDGTEWYALDQLMNPGSVVLTPAGIWNDDVVLYGRVATVLDSKVARDVMKRFNASFRKRFKKIKEFWVGHNAEVLLDAGMRLTIAEQSPRECDLTKGS